MFRLSNKLVIYFDNKIKIAWEKEGSFFNLQKVKIKIRSSKIIEQISHSFSSKEEIKKFIKDLDKKTQQVDLQSLWQEYSPLLKKPCNLRNFLQTRYEVITPFYVAIKRDFLYFKSCGEKFWVQDILQVEKIKKSQEAKKKLQNFYQQLPEILSQDNLQSYQDENFNQFVEKIEQDFYKSNTSSQMKLLQRANPWKMPAFWASFILLKKLGKLDANADFFIEANNLKSQDFSHPLDKVKHKENFVTSRPIITIDDAETYDVDDAFCIEKIQQGYKVTIFITDVSLLVAKDSFWDKQARKRASSVYLPTQFIDMFSRALAREKLSLRQGKICPAIAYEFVLSITGQELQNRLYCCNIKVTKKLTFKQVDQYLSCPPVDDISTACHWAFDIAKLLKEQRESNGAINLSKPYLKIRTFDDEITLKTINPQKGAYFLISQLMIKANWLSANFCVKNHIPCTYRVQYIQEKEVNGQLRQIKKTFDSLKPQPHQGLGISSYVQITSPIRRYQDLLISRQISNFIRTGQVCYTSKELEKLHCEVLPQMDYIRKVQDQSNQFYFLQWLSQQVGKTFSAKVIKKKKDNYLVELCEYFYICEVASSKSLTVGEQVCLALQKVCPFWGKVEFLLVESL